MAFKLQPLESFTRTDALQLLEITGDNEIMKWIGNGSIWTLTKIMKNISYAKEQAKISVYDRRLIAWGIKEGSNIVGYLSITKERKNSTRLTKRKTKSSRVASMISLPPNYYDVRIFIGSKYQGRGLATRALKLLQNKELRKLPLISLVNAENIASSRLHLSTGFTHLGRTLAYGKCLEVFIFNQK